MAGLPRQGQVARAALLSALLLAGACASPSPHTPPPSPKDPPRPAVRTAAEPAPAAAPSDDAVVARVGDEVIRESDLGAFLLRYFRDQANEALTHLVDELILDREAAKCGIELRPGLVTAETDAELERREKAAKMQFGEKVTLERYLAERYGVTVEEERRAVSRLLRTRLLRDRVIRYSQLREVLVTARFADFATYDQARGAADSARSGADFARLAAERALRPAVAPPPLSRDEVEPPDLAEELFTLPPGSVAGPVEVSVDGRKSYRIAKLVRRQAARDVSWDDVRGEIEAGISDRPIEPWEYARWARQVREAYQARVQP